MKREYDFSNAERGRFYRPGATLNLPCDNELPDWAGFGAPLGDFIAMETEKTLEAYRVQPNLVTEHANHEHDTAHGGYAHRQLFELVQNSADALAQADSGKSILVRLTKEYLYCADDGKPIDERGVEALMFSHMSPKRDTSEIGRFGLGFKSVLGVTDAPEFFSRAGSFRFDKKYAAERIAAAAPAERYPVLRLPVPADACAAMAADEGLRELMTWATNIVRLPLKSGAREDIAVQVRNFPPEFLLFVDHVEYLTLEDGDRSRDFVLQRRDGELRLDTGEGSSRWQCFKTNHRLSAEARQDRRSLDDGEDVPLWWAAPLDGLNQPGYFWHFFPTRTASLLAGILNAPWKTNEDRQNLLPGPYNDELIKAAAAMVADNLPALATDHDPALHLEALPRRREAGDNEHCQLLRERVYGALRTRCVVPDQDGRLRRAEDLHYAPDCLTAERLLEEPLNKWACVEGRPVDWLHHSALTRNRIAKVDQLSAEERESLAAWLEALVTGRDEKAAIASSRAALQVAASIPARTRRGERLGKILLTRSGEWCEPNADAVFLPVAAFMGPSDERLVHAELASDQTTANALRELGIKPISQEARFRSLAKALLTRYTSKPNDSRWADFWSASRLVAVDSAHTIIENRPPLLNRIRVRTGSGDWRGLEAVLLPGAIVAAANDEDNGVRVDSDYHDADLALLRQLGVVDAPHCDRDLSKESEFRAFRDRCRREFAARDLPSSPQRDYLAFKSTAGSGPLDVLARLSDEANARYTDALLSLESTYEKWIMRHATQGYPPLSCPNPAIDGLRRHGRIRCAGRTAPIKEALGANPANPAALRVLLSHPMADRIKEAFDLSEPVWEPVGEEDPVPVLDAWPGLARFLSADDRRCAVVRCQRIATPDEGNAEAECTRIDSTVYLAGTGDEVRDLRLVSRELGVPLAPHEVDEVLRYAPPHKIKARRDAIRELASDAERLAAAVGDDKLRSGLASSLLAVLETGRLPLTGVDLAEAAIVTYHTGALSAYRWALDHLAPPTRWAGSTLAVDFVRSLGFSAEWAGQRSSRRPPFLEVEGPCRLQPLHVYQRTIVDKARGMLLDGHAANGHRRGMISLPTGSGKTRVAVQAVVEAMRDGFDGDVLWVADRDELCEQAVEAWRQVWSSIGIGGKRLRISRMWGGQPEPVPTGDFHVIVATIQTLSTKRSKRLREYALLNDINLIVFDEAHRSVAPTFTSVMQDLGMTRWQRAAEPFLIGLTATPYRGHDEAETARLVNRYGGHRLDAGAFASDEPSDVIRELQDMRVLAHARHSMIEGGNFSLNDDELETMEAMPHPAWLPQSMENRIARDVERTRGIVAAYETFVGEVDRTWPTLIFATSVEHSQTVAALLSSQGVAARSVSGTTETSIRHNVVDEFRTKRINVLVNYGVFREGFDAPKTRVIIVARPVYSPNLYFQMIGRGLRGPLNGGDDECLVINVHDNIYNFDRNLAFAELDWLWG